MKGYKILSILTMIILLLGNYNMTNVGAKQVTLDENTPVSIQQSIVLNNNTELYNFITNYHFSGSGTNVDPFIIENLDFSITYSLPSGFNQSNLPLLSLKNTDKYIIIKNCTFDLGKYIFEGMMTFSNVSNVQVIQNTFNSPNQLTGLVLFDSGNIIVKDNYFKNNGRGILIQTYNDQLNNTQSKSHKQITISNNYFSQNYDAIYLVDYFDIVISNNYFKDNIHDAICNEQSPYNSSLDINHNIFDSNPFGVYFQYTFGTYQIYWNHFFNQLRYGIYFYAQNNGSIFNNNFIFNNTDYKKNSIFTATPQPNLKLINGTSGNYYTGYKGDSFKTGIPHGFEIYQYDQFPLEKPVTFNITINNEVYILPFFTTTNPLDQFIPILAIGILVGFVAAVGIVIKKKK